MNGRACLAQRDPDVDGRPLNLGTTALGTLLGVENKSTGATSSSAPDITSCKTPRRSRQPRHSICFAMLGERNVTGEKICHWRNKAGPAVTSHRRGQRSAGQESTITPINTTAATPRQQQQPHPEQPRLSPGLRLETCPSAHLLATRPSSVLPPLPPGLAGPQDFPGTLRLTSDTAASPPSTFFAHNSGQTKGYTFACIFCHAFSVTLSVYSLYTIADIYE